MLKFLPAPVFPVGVLILLVACAPSAPPSLSTAPTNPKESPEESSVTASTSESVEVAPRYQPKSDRSMEAIVAETLANSNYRPSERALKARPAAPTTGYATVKAPLAVQVGEIVVLEGDASTVSDLGDGDYGVVLSNFVQNPLAITGQFYQSFPDEFDAVTIFTTFPDGGSEGSVAWYLPIRLSVGGVGATQTDNGQAWGSSAALHGFINMQYVGQYGTSLTDPTSYVHRVMAQEFGHRWGSFAQYINSANEVSNAMLGRDGSHWASTLQANGSVMDGNELQELSPGNFRVTASNYRFSELDQYIMGLRGPEEVPDWFVVNDAVRNGNLINPEFPLQVGTTFSGTREDITIEQVIKAHGARNPDHLAAQKDFRLAVVLVTRPGETADDVSVFVDRLEQFRLTFEQAAATMSDKRMRVCTQVSAPCDSPRLSLAGVEFSEEQGNGDGAIDPGEVIRLTVSVSSTGFGEATNVSVGLGEVDERVRVIQQTVGMDNIPEGETLTAPEPLLIRVPYDEGCGGQIRIPLRLITEGRNFPAETAIEVGIDRIVLDTLEDPEGWTIDPYGTDTALGGAWEITAPKGVDALYTGVNLVTQPSEDHSITGVNALVTGAEGGTIGENDVDDGVTTALSPVYDISGARDPLLSVFLWRFAYDFNNINGIVEVENDPLSIEASVDGGASWKVLVSDTSNAQAWVRKDIRLRNQLELTGQIQLRLTMSDLGKATLNEALIDDILFWDESLVCRPDLVEGAESEMMAESTESAEPPLNPESAEADAGSTGGVPTEPGDESSGCQAANTAGPASPFVFGLVLMILGFVRRFGGDA